MRSPAVINVSAFWQLLTSSVAHHSESHGGRGGRGRGDREEAWPPSPADSSFQPHGFDRKDVRSSPWCTDKVFLPPHIRLFFFPVLFQEAGCRPSLYVLRWYYGKGKAVFDKQTLWLSYWLLTDVNNSLCLQKHWYSLQSCHIGEEDEGGEQEGEEPSFEVRQTEMVWGDQGKGTQGSQQRSSSPRNDHTRTHTGTPPPTPTLLPRP